jgi:HAE1 family hydrophobic/amphiphilic exporter-1
VFLPAAFLPGLTGQMYAQFALVIAATALISAINAVTLKPTQCALWLRPSVPPERRNIAFRAFNAVYDRLERAYAGLMRRLVGYAGLVMVVAMALTALTIFGFSRVPTGFIPVEDQGYMLATVQLPDGASLSRTQAVLDRAAEQARKTRGSTRPSPSPGCRRSITMPLSPIPVSSTSSSRTGAYAEKRRACYRCSTT